MNPGLTEKIKSSVDIVDVIKEHVGLRQAGRNFKALCPFHSEKTPSFMVSPEKQIFHCFGCGVGGDSVTFLMKHENIEFMEALEILARKAGITISRSDVKSPGRTSRFYETMEIACRFYERYLFTQDGKIAWAYLMKRGLDMAVIKKFRIGFSSSWDLLYRFLREKGFNEKDMEAVGLIARKGNGSYYDRFRERIIYPIMNEGGRVVGFGGRAIKKIEPKYLNSPDTPIYRKGMVLYGLNFAKRGISTGHRAIIVEGYMDFISLFQFGFDFCVATLGTALTPMQLALLRRFSPTLILAYDADKGGEEATGRGIEEALRAGFTVKVLELPKGSDPEEYIRGRGKDAMAAIIDNAPDFFNFRLKILEQKYSPAGSIERIKIVKDILSTIRNIPGAVEKAMYIKHLSERYSIPEETLRIELKNFKRDYKVNLAAPSGFPDNFSKERKVINIILSGGELSLKARRRLNPEDFEDKNMEEIMRLILETGRESEINVSAFLDKIGDEKLRGIVTGIVIEGEEKISAEKFLDEFVLNLEKRKHLRKARALIEEIKAEEKAGNLTAVIEKQRKYEELIRRAGGS